VDHPHIGTVERPDEVAIITVLHNNGLHQTGRGGAALSLCRRPVVEARPAGEAGC
jgi:hypothetical protein